ncbi:Uncharacterised protein [Xylophilus ampelinus]|nr:hypothetical protein [Variovorax sp.]VTY21067.1 Uncharacterised protein [Xylophilus ampelinus]
MDWHLSGHSHRSGIYKVRWQQDNARATATRRIQVISAGGGIEYQNVDGELSAWTGRLPAGTVLDPSSGKIKQVKTERSHADDGKGFNEKPRLCVALDYLHVMSGIEGKGGLGKNGAIEVPLLFKVLPTLMGPGKGDQLEVVLSEQMKKLECIAGVTLWVFEGGSVNQKNKITPPVWHRISLNLDKPGNPTRATPVREGLELLQRALAAGVPYSPGEPGKLILGRRAQATFCEVSLKKAKATAADEDWAKDRHCTDPWVLPVDLISGDGKTMTALHRPVGERGEVPDWDWLAATWGETPTKTGNKYPDPLEVINPNAREKR